MSFVVKVARAGSSVVTREQATEENSWRGATVLGSRTAYMVRPKGVDGRCQCGGQLGERTLTDRQVRRAGWLDKVERRSR